MPCTENLVWTVRREVMALPLEEVSAPPWVGAGLPSWTGAWVKGSC